MSISSAFSTSSVVHAVLGGTLLGLSATVLLLGHGRIAGISGLVGRLPHMFGLERTVAVLFLFGMVATGFVAKLVAPDAIGGPAPGRNLLVVAVAGLLVGFGTRMGNGCTSGHGICGLSRGSARSLVATVSFMGAGMLAATMARLFLGGQP